MGSTSSKFKKNLQQGDEYAAMKIYQNSPELRKYLDPNVSYGEHHNHNTALHYAAKHGKSYFCCKISFQSSIFWILLKFLLPFSLKIKRIFHL